MKTELTKYEKIITINEENFTNLFRCMNLLFHFVQEKCQKDNEYLEYFQLNFTDSEKNQYAKDLKIQWAISQSEKEEK